MQFGIAPKTSGDHILGVTTTGADDVWVDGEHVYHRDQEMDLIFESCGFLMIMPSE
jgi:beta-glucosidase